MPFYISESVRKTWLRYLIEAKDDDDALDKDGEYLGYLDGDTEGFELHGPYDTEEEALANYGHVDGS